MLESDSKFRIATFDPTKYGCGMEYVIKLIPDVMQNGREFNVLVYDWKDTETGEWRRNDLVMNDEQLSYLASVIQKYYNPFIG